MKMRTNRRGFLKSSAVAGAAIVGSKAASAMEAGAQTHRPTRAQRGGAPPAKPKPAAATAASATKTPGANERIRIAAIGTGGRCRDLLAVLSGLPGQEVVALCDVYEPNLLAATEWAAPGVALETDYHRILDRKDIDAVVIASPNHWHARMLIDAVQAGKDVYCEKPMTHTIAEGPKIVSAVQASGRIVQTGTQQRSWPHWLLAGQLIDEGMLGTITFVHTYWYQSYGWQPPTGPDRFMPDRLEWAHWLGDAPSQPLDREKFYNWRWFWDFGGGALTDLMTHWIDMIQRYIHQPAPLEASTIGNNYLHPMWQCPDTVTCALQYPGKVSVTYTGTMSSNIDDGGVVIRGTRATLKIDRDRLAVYPEEAQYLPHRNHPEPELEMISERDGTIDHMQNWLDCMRTRQTPNANVQVAMEAARTSHLGNLAFRAGKRAAWDEATGAVKYL
jgi:predicted dehydrogenase